MLMRAIGTVHARMSNVIAYSIYAAVAELADAQDLKSCGGDIVPVRFRSAALVKSRRNVEFTAFLLFFCFKKFEHFMMKYQERIGFLPKLMLYRTINRSTLSRMLCTRKSGKSLTGYSCLSFWIIKRVR